MNLIFEKSGWCEELKTSYRRGHYTCKNQKEYDVLKKYAKGVKEVEPTVNEDEVELRQLAKESGIKSWHNKSIDRIKAELEAG